MNEMVERVMNAMKATHLDCVSWSEGNIEELARAVIAECYLIIDEKWEAKRPTSVADTGWAMMTMARTSGEILEMFREAGKGKQS